jgi:hypothetical protein
LEDFQNLRTFIIPIEKITWHQLILSAGAFFFGRFIIDYEQSADLTGKGVQRLFFLNPCRRWQGFFIAIHGYLILEGINARTAEELPNTGKALPEIMTSFSILWDSIEIIYGFKRLPEMIAGLLFAFLKVSHSGRGV